MCENCQNSSAVEKEMVMIHKDKLIFGNTKTDKWLVKEIAERYDPEQFTPISCYWTGEGFIITDGNHRAQALIQRGEELVPAFLLTSEEFQFVACSDRVIDVKVFVPEFVRAYR
jgi:hypothetical protein